MKGINKITTLAGLKTYALRKLGDGVINIEITPEQQTDLIDDALQMFCKYHDEGVSLTYSLLAVTAALDKYTLDDDILAIPYMIEVTQEVLSEPTFSIQWEFLNERRWIGDIDLIGFELLAEKMKMIDIKFRQETGYNFNTTTHQIQFIPAPVESKTLALRVYKMNDPYDFPDIYNNDWLKKYVVACFREQWGDNLCKYSGVPLPGGSTLNAEGIRSKGEKDREALEKELQDTHRLPIDIICG
jgi:hypothetical protein